MVFPKRSTPNCAHFGAGRVGKTPFSRTGRQACSWCPHSQGGTWGTRAGPRPPFALSRAARRAPVHRPPTQRHWPRPDLADLLVPAARPLPPGQARPLPSHLWPVQRPLPDLGALPPSLKSTHRSRKGRPGRRGPGGARSSWRAGPPGTAAASQARALVLGG